MNSISGVQWQHTNQHSLLSWTSPHHLKLRPHDRQMAQHISWSQGCSTSPLISKSILWTSTPVWTTPDIGWLHLHVASLPKQHAINFLLNRHYSKNTKPHCMATSQFMIKQWLKIKSSIVDTNNHLNKVFSTFDSLNRELSSGFYLINTFPDCFFSFS